MRKSLFLCCFAAALLLAGCASGPVPTAKAKPAPAPQIFAPASMLKPCAGCGIVIVKRDAHTMMAVGSKEHTFLDGKKIADLWPGEKITLYLPPAHYVLSATFAAWAGAPTKGFDLRAGERRVYRLAQESGFGSGAPLILEATH